MATIDIIFIILVALGALSGFVNGLLKQIATIFGLVAGLFIAKALYLSVAQKICPVITDSMTVAQIIAFIAIWILVPLVCSLIASLLSGLLNAISLGWVNKLLGFVLGAIISILVISIALNVIDFIDSSGNFISQTAKNNSSFYYSIKGLIGWLFPAIGKAAEPYIAI